VVVGATNNWLLSATCSTWNAGSAADQDPCTHAAVNHRVLQAAHVWCMCARAKGKTVDVCVVSGPRGTTIHSEGGSHRGPLVPPYLHTQNLQICGL
jgi:hypothetical protein